MRYLSLTILAFCATGGAAAAAEPPHGETMLAAALKGRTAGEPVDCITKNRIRSLQVIDGIGLLYETVDGTRYLNRPETGADWLDDMDVVLSDTGTPEICSIDVIKLHDQGTRQLRGVAKLGTFVPYKKRPNDPAAGVRRSAPSSQYPAIHLAERRPAIR